MNNSILRRAIAVSLVMAAGAALTGCNEGAAGKAPVAQAAAAESRTVAREECHDEVFTRTAKPKDNKQVAGTAIDAVIGGVIGNQIGSGDGKKLATVGGAVAGGYAGNRIQENNQDDRIIEETRRVCKTVYDKV